jgi:hypothetical protein
MALMIEAIRTSETSVDNHLTRQYIAEDSSEHHGIIVFGFSAYTNPSLQSGWHLF